MSLLNTMTFVFLSLTHWGRVTHMCVNKLTIIGSDNGLSPGRRHAIIWTDAGILLIGHLGTNFSEILVESHAFSFKKIHLKMSSGKWRSFCLGLNVLTISNFIEQNCNDPSSWVCRLAAVSDRWTRSSAHSRWAMICQRYKCRHALSDIHQDLLPSNL